MHNNVRIMGCVCSHEYQDGRYGKGNRVWNEFKNGFRCTVCGRTHLESKRAVKVVEAEEDAEKKGKK